MQLRALPCSLPIPVSEHLSLISTDERHHLKEHVPHFAYINIGKNEVAVLVSAFS